MNHSIERTSILNNCVQNYSSNTFPSQKHLLAMNRGNGVVQLWLRKNVLSRVYKLPKLHKPAATDTPPIHTHTVYHTNLVARQKILKTSSFFDVLCHTPIDSCRTLQRCVCHLSKISVTCHLSTVKCYVTRSHVELLQFSLTFVGETCPMFTRVKSVCSFNDGFQEVLPNQYQKQVVCS